MRGTDDQGCYAWRVSEFERPGGAENASRIATPRRFTATLYKRGETQPQNVHFDLGPEGIALVNEATITDNHSATCASPEEMVLPYELLMLDRGGYDGDFLFLHNPVFGRLACRDPELLGALEMLVHPAIERQLVGVRRAKTTRRRRRATGFFVVAAIMVSIALLIWKTPAILAEVATHLPIELDAQIGDAAFDQMELPGRRLQDARLRALAEEIIGRLEKHAAVEGLDYRVTIAASEDPNAFALPGGQIVLLTGLVTTAEASDEVAAVLAHEIAHATLRHGLRNIVHSVGSSIALGLVFGDAGGLGQLAGEAALLVSSNAYSREQESAADAEGARMMAAAGLDPLALARFFERMADVPGTELNGAMSWLSTHPEHEERRKAIAELARELPRAKASPLKEDFAAAKEAARQAIEETAGGESVEAPGEAPTPRP